LRRLHLLAGPLLWIWNTRLRLRPAVAALPEVDEAHTNPAGKLGLQKQPPARVASHAADAFRTAAVMIGDLEGPGKPGVTAPRPRPSGLVDKGKARLPLESMPVSGLTGPSAVHGENRSEFEG